MNAIALIISVLAGLWSATTFGPQITAAYGLWEYPLVGPVVAFLGGYLVVNALLALPAGSLVLEGGGIWTASPVRWFVGKMAFAMLAIPTFWIIWRTLPGFAKEPVDPLQELIVAIVFTFAAVPVEKRVLAYVTLPLRQLLRALKTGVGGSSSFMGLLDEWRMPWKPGGIILGTSLYEPGKRIGKSDDRHMITIATNRSGKGRSCIIPNLLTWPGSVLVVDPKGENAAITVRARRALGQKVFIVDPFDYLTKKAGLHPVLYRSQRLNPLAEIRLDDRDVVEQIRNLAAALVMITPHGNPFWDNASRQILEGVIAHVLTWPEIADDERNLVTVRDYVTETNGRSMRDLRGNRRLGGLADKAEAQFRKSSDTAGSDVMMTLNVHMQWLDSLAMCDALASSDFTLRNLKKEKATVFLVIPPGYLETHARFLRVFITLALKSAEDGAGGEHPMLFLLDEFAALGELKVVVEAAGKSAGLGVKLWPIVQNLTQLRELYGENTETLLGNASQQQVFAVNDQSTVRYFSERLGHHISWRKVHVPGRANEFEWVPQGPTFLRTSVELSRESSRDSGKALIFFEGGEAAILRRAAYDQIFHRNEYAPNPYVKGGGVPELFSLAGVKSAGGFLGWIGVFWGKMVVALFERATGEVFDDGLTKDEHFALLREENRLEDEKRDEERAKLKAEYMKVDAFIKAENNQGMTPDERAAFGKKLLENFRPFFETVTKMGFKSHAEMGAWLGIKDEPAAPQEPVKAEASPGSSPESWATVAPAASLSPEAQAQEDELDAFMRELDSSQPAPPKTRKPRKPPQKKPKPKLEEKP